MQDFLTVPGAIAAAWTSELELHLSREDIGFLCGIHTWTNAGAEVTLDEGRLQELFGIVNEVSHGDPATMRQRATSAIARLRDQHMLSRLDAAGFARSGLYCVTPLGKGISEFILRKERLTPQNLVILTSRICADLAAVKAAARAGGDAEHWRSEVDGPLRVSVVSLIDGIDQRQRVMDGEQEEVRTRISAMLDRDWARAITECEELLERTSSTLTELHRTMMEEVDGINELLLEIGELAAEARQERSTDAVEGVQVQIERIASWGEVRVASWSEYYQTVHGFIRSYVRIDRDRAVSRRLGEAIRAFPAKSWAATICAAEAYVHLRAPEIAVPTERVARRREDRRTALEDEAPSEVGTDLVALVEARLRAQGCVTLTDLLIELFPEAEEGERFRLAGDLVEAMAKRGEAPRREPWVPVMDGVEVQQLTVTKQGAVGGV